jgi:hypothetical protein
MSGLDSYPTWVRDGVGCALLLAAGLTASSSQLLALVLVVMAVGLIVPSRKKPPA